MLKLGILDQSPVLPGMTAADAMRSTIELAREAERLGFTRFWVSEHHDSPGLAGSAPEVLIAAIAAHTSRIRVGSGGVMLSHYSPYKVAEQFRVLEALYPNRIDLGVGRAPGGMPLASMALRYGKPGNRQERFNESLELLGGFLGGGFPEGHEYAELRTMPEIGTRPEVWLLGSSEVSAVMAARLGAPFSFAHFINWEGGQGVVRDYRASFQPGPFGSEPRANAAVSVLCAETDEEAERLAAPIDIAFLLMEKEGGRRRLPAPEEALAYPLTNEDRERIRTFRGRYITGGPGKVKAALEEFAGSYGVDELVVTTMGRFEDRVKSYRLLAEHVMNR